MQHFSYFKFTQISICHHSLWCCRLRIKWDDTCLPVIKQLTTDRKLLSNQLTIIGCRLIRKASAMTDIYVKVKHAFWFFWKSGNFGWKWGKSWDFITRLVLEKKSGKMKKKRESRVMTKCVDLATMALSCMLCISKI